MPVAKEGPKLQLVKGQKAASQKLHLVLSSSPVLTGPDFPRDLQRATRADAGFGEEK